MALTGLGYDQLMATPPAVLAELIPAHARARAKHLFETAVRNAMVGEVNWGQKVEGDTGPAPAYRVLDTPFRMWLKERQDAYDPLTPGQIREQHSAALDALLNN